MTESKYIKLDKLEYLPCKKEELEQYSFPKFTKPTEILSFSIDAHRTVVFDRSQCKIYRSPEHGDELKFDLNEGYDTHIPKSNDSEFINKLLEGVSHTNVINSSNFVCWRGLLTKIASTPYESGQFAEGWIVLAMKIKSTVYLCECKTEEAKLREANQTERNKLMSYWGHKFEDYVTTNTESKTTSKNSSPINLNEEYVSVVQSSLDGMKILFGGEVDCCIEKNINKYIELKTTRKLSAGSYSFRRYKLIKWWLQSFLLGIDTIVCGNRDDDGIVQSIREYPVSDIPRTLGHERAMWRPAACFRFLSKFLQFVKQHVTEEETVYVFTKELNKDFVEMTTSQSDDHQFIPSWFLSKIKSETE